MYLNTTFRAMIADGSMVDYAKKYKFTYWQNGNDWFYQPESGPVEKLEIDSTVCIDIDKDASFKNSVNTALVTYLKKV